MNHVEMFKRMQRLQDGTEDVHDKVPPFFVNGKWWWERPPELRPMELMPDNEEDLSPEELRREQEAYKRRVQESQHYAEGGSDIPAPPGAGELVKPPNLPYIQGGGLFGSNYWPAWVRYGLGALPYAGPLFNTARTGYNIYDRIHWAMTQPKLPGGQGGDPGTAPADDGSNVTAPTSNDTPTPGVGIDPTGMPADPGEWWSDDFGRWSGGDKYGTTPGDYWNQGGPGGPAGTRGIGGGGFYRTTIPGGNDQNFMPTLGGAMPAASGGGAYGGNTMAKIAMHGTFKDVATPEQWAFMQNYLQGGQGGGGSGAGVGGAGRPMTQSRQMGTSDVNPGLKLFHAKQLKRKNKIK